MKIFDDATNLILARQMDACTLRQRVIADNVANVNTPGFKKSTVNFQQQLRAALGNGTKSLKTTHPRHIPSRGALSALTPEVVQVKETSMNAGGNNVDIDAEMVDLAANTLLYQLVTRAKSERSAILSYVIKGGS